MEAVQGGPHHALPARADLFEQLVLVERGARVKIVQPDRFGGGHESVGSIKGHGSLSTRQLLGRSAWRRLAKLATLNGCPSWRENTSVGWISVRLSGRVFLQVIKGC